MNTVQAIDKITVILETTMKVLGGHSEWLKDLDARTKFLEDMLLDKEKASE